MARPSKYSPELRERAVRMVLESEKDYPHRFLTRFGARKMWLHLRSKGHDVARCTIERLYRTQGWQGAMRRRKVKPMPSDQTPRPADRVDRGFWAARPNRLWVADFSYVSTWCGMVYVAFVIDVFSRRILGWRAATRMTTDLVLDAFEHALWSRQQEGIPRLDGLVHHTDAGSQGVSFALTQRLVDEGVDPSVGSNHDPYDNALAESTIGLFKAELIRPDGPWRSVEHVELETLRWVDFYNTTRPHEALEDLTPMQAEDLHYQGRCCRELCRERCGGGSFSDSIGSSSPPEPPNQVSGHAGAVQLVAAREFAASPRWLRLDA